MRVQELYSWEIETNDGTITSQFNEDGSENTWKKLETDNIVRISFIPKLAQAFPRHDCFLSGGTKFVRRFGRGFIKQSESFNTAEYLNCLVTNRYRVYVFHSSGRVLVTDRDHEVYI